MSRVAVAIMAKAPRPGEVKTRLSPPLGAPEGAALYRCFLLDKIAAVRALVRAQPVIAYRVEKRGSAGTSPVSAGLQRPGDCPRSRQGAWERSAF
jgi:glycosyltransferase A (GT-A) superfamily protein (DUF2064 family)